MRRPWPGAAQAWVLLLAAGAVLLPPIWGQRGQPAKAAIPEIHVSASAWRLPPLLLRAQSDLVEDEVVVRDQNGSPIAGLTRDRFQVRDNGQLRPLSFFSVVGAAAGPAVASGPAPAADVRGAVPAASAPPRSIAMLFDDVFINSGDLLRARQAATAFVRGDLGAHDQVGIFTSSATVSLGFTRDRAALAAAIAKIGLHPRLGTSISDCPRISPYEAYLIIRFNDRMALDAVAAEKAQCDRRNGMQDSGSLDSIKMLAEATWSQARGMGYDLLKTVDYAVDDLAQRPGQRDLIFTSDGFMSGELEALKDGLTQRALRAGVVINTLSARGLNGAGPGRPLNQNPSTLPTKTYMFEESTRFDQQQSEGEALQQLAEATGGQFFHNSNDLALGFRHLGLEPAFRYELGFNPEGLPHDGKFHTLAIQLTPSVHGAEIEARRGYFAPGGRPTADDMEAALQAAMRGTAVAAAVPASLHASASAGALTVEVRLDVAQLPFVSRQGRREQQIVFIAGLFDPASNRFITGKRGVMDLALTPATEKLWEREGLGGRVSLAAPPGRYRLRVVVLESTDGKLAELNAFAEIPVATARPARRHSREP